MRGCTWLFVSCEFERVHKGLCWTTDVFRHMIRQRFERCWDAPWSLKLFDARCEWKMRSEKRFEEGVSAVRFQHLTLKTSGYGRSNTNIRSMTTQDSVLTSPDDVVRWRRLRCSVPICTRWCSNFHIQSHLLLEMEAATCHR